MYHVGALAAFIRRHQFEDVWVCLGFVPQAAGEHPSVAGHSRYAWAESTLQVGRRLVPKARSDDDDGA